MFLCRSRNQQLIFRGSLLARNGWGVGKNGARLGWVGDVSLSGVSPFSQSTQKKAKTKAAPLNTRSIGALILGDLRKQAETSDVSESLEISDVPNSRLLQTIQEYQQANPQYLTLVRVGDFYEVYYEQADLIGQLLGLSVVNKSVKTHTYRFTGFGFRQLERHLETLVNRLGQSVAILEQYQDPISKLYERKLDRIYTPGTLVGEQFLDSGRSNYLLALSFSSDCTVGMAWIDLATGDFQMASSPSDELDAELARLKPREIIVPSTSTMDESKWIGAQWTHEPIDTFLDKPKQLNSLVKKLKNFTPLEMEAGFGLLNYIIKTQGGRDLDLKLPVLREDPRRLKVDAAVLQCLEVSSKERTSLLSSLNETRTKAGSRLLAARLVSPSTDILTINNRLDLITEFQLDPKLCDTVREALKGSSDAQRFLQKLSLRHAVAQDLLEIMATLRCAETLKKSLSESNSPAIQLQLSRLPIPSDLAANIERAYDDGTSEECTTRGSVRSSYNMRLTNLHFLKDKLEKERDEFEIELRNSLGAKSLKLVSSPGYGHIVELPSREEAVFLAAVHHLPTPPVLFQSLKGKKRYYISTWTDLGCKIEQVTEELYEEERTVFETVSQQILEERDAILACSRTIAELDVATTIAKLSHRFGLVRPTVDTTSAIDIQGARHLSVELALQNKRRQFTPNNCRLDANHACLGVITGPNMGGKSTYLRQVAIVIIMAQAGLFVPAESARIGIVDQLFSRVGSADNLTNEQSTFMVEMQEMATILRKATKSSMVIVDEIGRGTSTFEGEAIAFAILKHMHDNLRCRSLFATHFHRIAIAASDSQNPRFHLPSTVNYHTRVLKLEDGSFTYLHGLRPGVSNNSCALLVAQLAGIPPPVIREAENFLMNPLKGDPASEKNIENDSKFNEITQKLQSIDVTSLTPINALLLVQQLQDMVKNASDS